MKRYAVKYLNNNGYTVSYGYIETMNIYEIGQIIETWSGQKIKIDFEV